MSLSWNRRKKIGLLTRFMDVFGISAKQVVVLPRSAGKKKAVYCKEFEVIINRFFQIYKKQISRKTVMFHDSAKFFDTVCGSLINEGLLGQNVEYPSAIHQHLSPNDNILHGAAKATWRNSIYYEGKHVTVVESSLCLLSQLGSFEPKVVKGRFQKNSLLDKLNKNITKEESEDS